jgi:hypothetical protein
MYVQRVIMECKNLLHAFVTHTRISSMYNLIEHVEQGRQCSLNVTMRCVRATIVAVETQTLLLVLSVSVALLIEHIMRMRLIVICGLPGSTVSFHIIS